MPTIQASIDIHASATDVFALAQDYALRLVWDPFLAEMKFRDGATEANVGVRVWVRAKNGMTMEVRYITLRAPEHVAMTMTDGPTVFSQFSGAWTFKALAADRTHVVFRYNFATRPRLLAPVMEPVVAMVLKREMQARLVGLKRGVEETDILSRLPPR